MWGKQLGNNIEFGIKAGVNYGTSLFNSNVNFLLNPSNEPITSKNVLVPFFSTFSQVGVGILLPRKKNVATDNCEFLKCNYVVNRLFKLNLNDAIFIDQHVQKVKTDLGFEQRVGKSNWAVNSNISFAFSNFKNLEILSVRDSSFFSSDGRGPFRTVIPEFGNKNVNNFTQFYMGTSQLRYYFKSRKSDKIAKNFNGFYSGLEYSFLYKKLTVRPIPYGIPVKSQQISSFSGIIGHQTQTSLGTFVDFTFSLGFENIKSHYVEKFSPVGLSNFNQVHAKFSLKLGLAK
jgi:hypothetical protein